LPLMPVFYEKTKELAAAIAALPGVLVTPNPPHANAMIIAFPGEQDSLVDAAIEVAEQTGLWLYDLPLISPIQGIVMFEITIREAGLDVSVEEAVQAISLLRELLVAG